jgi:hypothetical protein
MEKTTQSTQGPSQTQQSGSFFRKILDEQSGRLGSVFSEAQKLESKWLEYSTSAVDELAGLTKGSIQYMAELTGEWRKLSLEALRRSADHLPTWPK